MKTKFIYIVHSLVEDNFIVFGTRKRAEQWIKHYDKSFIFEKSTQNDLFICERIIF